MKRERLSFRFESPPDADIVQVALHVEAGGCEDASPSSGGLYQATYTIRDGEAELATRGGSRDLRDGRYAVYARGLDASCRWSVRGCVNVRLPRADPTVTVVLEADAQASRECAPELCREGACRKGRDAGPPDERDSGSMEAGAVLHSCADAPDCSALNREPCSGAVEDTCGPCLGARRSAPGSPNSLCCPLGSIELRGECLDCARDRFLNDTIPAGGPAFHPSQDRTRCVTCPAGSVPDEDNEDCLACANEIHAGLTCLANGEPCFADGTPLEVNCRDNPVDGCRNGKVDGFTLRLSFDEPGRVVTGLRFRADATGRRPDDWELWSSFRPDSGPGTEGARKILEGKGQPGPWQCEEDARCARHVAPPWRTVPTECCPNSVVQSPPAAGTPKWDVARFEAPLQGPYWWLRIVTTQTDFALLMHDVELVGNDCAGVCFGDDGYCEAGLRCEGVLCVPSE